MTSMVDKYQQKNHIEMCLYVNQNIRNDFE